MIYFLRSKSNCKLKVFPLGTQSNNGLNYKFCLILIFQVLSRTYCSWSYFFPYIDAIYRLFITDKFPSPKFQEICRLQSME